MTDYFASSRPLIMAVTSLDHLPDVAAAVSQYRYSGPLSSEFRTGALGSSGICSYDYIGDGDLFRIRTDTYPIPAKAKAAEIERLSARWLEDHADETIPPRTRVPADVLKEITSNVISHLSAQAPCVPVYQDVFIQRREDRSALIVWQDAPAKARKPMVKIRVALTGMDTQVHPAPLPYIPTVVLKDLVDRLAEGLSVEPNAKRAAQAPGPAARLWTLEALDLYYQGPEGKARIRADVDPITALNAVGEREWLANPVLTLAAREDAGSEPLCQIRLDTCNWTLKRVAWGSRSEEIGEDAPVLAAERVARLHRHVADLFDTFNIDVNAYYRSLG